jgi:hypothetical protein
MHHRAGAPRLHALPIALLPALVNDASSVTPVLFPDAHNRGRAGATRQGGLPDIVRHLGPGERTDEPALAAWTASGRYSTSPLP